MPPLASVGYRLPTIALKKYYAYIDESGTHEGSVHECIALALIPETSKEQFEVAWNTLLDKWNLRVLHMTDFNGYKKEFAGWDSTRSHEFSVKVMSVIEDHVEFWMGNVFETGHRRLVESDGAGPSLYFVGCGFLLRSMGDWAKTHGEEVHVSYVLERGAVDQRKLNRALTKIVASDEASQAPFCHVSHSFEEKSVPGLQVADIFAWQLHVDARRFDRAQNRRSDFVRLLTLPHFVRYFDEQSLRLVVEGLAG